MKYYEIESEILLRKCSKRGEGKSKKEKWEKFRDMVKLLNKLNENIEFCRNNGYGILMRKYVDSLDEVMISVYVNYSLFKEE